MSEDEKESMSSFIVERIYETEEMEKREKLLQLKKQNETPKKEKKKKGHHHHKHKHKKKEEEEEKVEEEPKNEEEEKEEKEEEEKIEEEPKKEEEEKVEEEKEKEIILEDKKSIKLEDIKSNKSAKTKKTAKTKKSSKYKVKKDETPVKLMENPRMSKYIVNYDVNGVDNRKILEEILEELKKKQVPKPIESKSELPFIDNSKHYQFPQKTGKSDYLRDYIPRPRRYRRTPSFDNFDVDPEVQRGMVIELLKLRKGIRDLEDRTDELDCKNEKLLDLLKNKEKGNNYIPFFCQPVSLPNIENGEIPSSNIKIATPQKTLHKSMSVPHYDYAVDDDNDNFFGVMKSSIKDLDQQLNNFYSKENAKRKGNFFY